MHVNDVGADTIQKILGVGDEHEDALKAAKTEPNQKALQAGRQLLTGT